MSLYERIPNNVNLSSDKRLLRALEHWLPNYMQWWNDMGPEGFQADDVYLRTAISRRAGRLGAFRLREDARLPLGHLSGAAGERTARSASATTWASRPGRKCPASTATCCAA